MHIRALHRLRACQKLIACTLSMVLARGDVPALLVTELPACLGVGVCLQTGALLGCPWRLDPLALVQTAPCFCGWSPSSLRIWRTDWLAPGFFSRRLPGCVLCCCPLARPIDKPSCLRMASGIHLCQHTSAVCFQLVHLVNPLTLSSVLASSGLTIL